MPGLRHADGRRLYQKGGKDPRAAGIRPDAGAEGIVTAFAARYREEAVRVGNQTVADMLAWIPANAPRTLLEALQFLRLLHYAMWCNGNYHNTLGRIDQFLYPYYRHDGDAGLLTKDEALEQLEEFIAGHLKIWLPGFCNDVIAQTRTPYYRALCELTDKLVDEL